ncbi:hypothetical protein BGX38DRAFT_1224720 [Terfezia claveryi]|nr:hypothetical protein BGX38DRAFT_1224720 [Terfezia claveryi]
MRVDLASLYTVTVHFSFFFFFLIFISNWGVSDCFVRFFFLLFFPFLFANFFFSCLGRVHCLGLWRGRRRGGALSKKDFSILFLNLDPVTSLYFFFLSCEYVKEDVKM